MMQLSIDGPMFTIGYSTRTLTEFVALLRQVDVTMVADVRVRARRSLCHHVCRGGVRRCHRRIITDYLLAGGTHVDHIWFRVEAADMPHRKYEFARDGRPSVMITMKPGGEPETVAVLNWMTDFPDAVRAADSAH